MKKQTWTLKHDAFCLEHKLTGTAKLLWQWLLANYKEDQDIEPDLEKDFNSWVEKHLGKRRHVNTIKNALNQLIECQVVQLVKKWNWHEVRIAIFPPNWFKPKKTKNSQNNHPIDEKQPSNPENIEDGIYSSSIDISCLEPPDTPPENIISEDDIAEYEQVLTECENAGIVFNPVQSPEILNYSLEEVKMAIALFKKKGVHQKIHNPQGWLLLCLRRRWYDQARNWSMTDLFTALSELFPQKIDNLIPY